MEEQSRADRFSNSTSQCAFIKTRGHLRGLLGSYLGISPDKVGLTVNEHGKPRLSKTEENQGLVFNVSHSGNLAVLAFGLDTVIGVDVERIRVRGGLERLAEYALSAVELERWHRLPSEHRPEQFIRYWNIKEAFVKATGRGIVLGLNQVVVADDFQGLQSVPPGFEPASDWVLHTGVMDDYRYALVYRKPERVIRLYDEGLDSLPSTVRNDS